MNGYRAIIVILAAMLAGGAFNPAQAGMPLAGGMQNAAPDFHLEFAPMTPEAGKEITVSLVMRTPPPAGTTVRWNIAGASISNAGVKNPANPGNYSFTPDTPGSYMIQVGLYDAQGRMFGSSTLDITIGGSVASHLESVPSGQPAQMYLDILPTQPRIGQPVQLTFKYGNGIPAGSELRWDVSGGPASAPAFSGPGRETCTFVPGSQGPYLILARLHTAQGMLAGEISLSFIAIP